MTPATPGWEHEAGQLLEEVRSAHLPLAAGGGSRSIPPAETLERALPLAPGLGITRLANITGLDCIGIPVVVACRPNARGLATSQGKGVDLESAKASALMEAVERQQAEQVDLPRRLASLEELEGAVQVLDPAQLPAAPGRPWNPSLPLAWAPGVDLLAREPGPTWVPFEVLHTNWSVPPEPSTGSLAMSANGLASGNHVVEAAFHGLCELIERDAVTVLTCTGEHAVDERRVDLATVDDAVCRRLLELYELAGVDVAVWDATSDVGVATFIALVADRDRHQARELYAARGSGTHPRRGVALSRALTEAAQSRLSFIAGSRDDMLREEYEQVTSPGLAEHTRNVLAKPARRAFDAAPDDRSGSVEGYLAGVLDRLAATGFGQAIVVDLRREPLRIPVVRVLVPGLEADLEDGALPGRRARHAMLAGARS